MTRLGRRLDRRLDRRAGRLAIAALMALAAIGPGSAPAVGAEPDLSRPAAAVRFLTDITFTGTAALSGPVRRIEIVLDLQGSKRSVVAEVASSGSSGTLDLEYVLETPGGSILPNTDVTARFRATLDDGTLVDGPSVTVAYDDTRFNWRVLSGDLVTVRWTEGGAAFGERALRIGEAAVRDVGGLLGVTESDPIDFYVYADRTAFYDILGPASRENVGGQAQPGIRTLFANIAPDAIDDPWVGVVIPHELTHLVFDTAVANPYHYPPRWLNEGIAVYLSDGVSRGDRNAVDDAVRSGTLVPIRGLAGQFPTTAEQFSLAYAESVSAVDYLVRTYGRSALVTLVRSYAAGVTDDEAFRAALGTDVAGFEAAWLASIGAPRPSPFGPQVAPPGPVPSDWLGEGPVPGRIPDVTASPGTATPGPAAPGGSDAAVQPAALVGGLVAAGILLFGLAWRLGRRNRSSSSPQAGSPAAEPAATSAVLAAPASAVADPAGQDAPGADPAAAGQDPAAREGQST